MPDTRMVNIRHPKTGREYAILPSHFTRKNVHPKDEGSYAEQGYEIVGYEDGSEYAGPKNQREIEKAIDDRLATRRAVPKPDSDARPPEKAKA